MENTNEKYNRFWFGEVYKFDKEVLFEIMTTTTTIIIHFMFFFYYLGQ